MFAPRILIVEDEVVTAKHLQASLSGCGYVADLVASTGEQAVRLAQESKPDLAIMDIMLDVEMDGIEAARRIRSNLDIPIIYLTAYSDETVLKRAKVTEPFGYLIKPFRIEELRTTIEIALYRHKMEKDLKEREQSLGQALLGTKADLTKTESVARIGHWALDPKSGQVTGSEELYDIFGIKQERATFEEFGVLVHPDDRDFRLDHIRRGIERGESWDIEYRLLCKDGTQKWVHSVGEAEREENGETTKLFGIVHDITERKQLEQELEEERYLRSLVLDALPYPAMIVRRDRTIVSANRVAWEEGARVGGYCWQTFRHGRYISCGDREYVDDHGKVPPRGTSCSFCLAEEAMSAQQPMNNREIEALGRIWDTHWVPLSDEVLLHYAIDVTDRVKAEAEVQRQNTFLKNVLNSLKHPFYVIDMDDYRITLANPAARALGASEGSTCYSTTHGLEKPCDGASHPCTLEEVRRTGLPTVLEHIHYDSDGNERIIEVHGYPILDRERKPVQLIEYCVDVTERVKAQESLRQNESMLDTILSMSPSGVTYYRDGIIRWVNRAALKLFGYDEDDRDLYVSKDVQDFYESPEEYDRVVKTFKAQIAAGRTPEAEARLRRKDGSIFIGNVSTSSRTPDGHGVGQTVIVSDITERKRAEEDRTLLMKAIHQAGESVAVTDAGGIIQYVNPAFEMTTGYTALEAVGQTLRILKIGECHEGFYRELSKTLSRGRSWTGRLASKKKDGGTLEADATISPVHDAFGKVISHVAVMRDVTDKIMLEKQLRQAQKMESIGTLAGGIAHDFNNLLQVILASTYLLIMGKDPDSRDYANLETIRKSVESGRDLVKGLLTFTRQVDSALRFVDLNRHLESFQDILARTIPKTIDINLIPGDDLSAVNADPVQLEQVLVNLAVNARDAMPDGGRITIETGNVTLDDDYCRSNVEANPGQYVMLKVSDTGCGMTKDVLERIWEPFYTTKALGEGTGLGLSVVYGIVKNHGGHISCSSEPGQGTAFAIYIPAIVEESQEKLIETDTNAPGMGTETILLVDDEESVLFTLEKILEHGGYRVYTAKDGRDALEIYRAHMEEIDLIVLDLMMPEMDGWRCLEEILRLDPEAGILVSSGFSANTIPPRALELGALGFLSKPFAADELLRVVRKTLDDTGSLSGSSDGANRSSAIPDDHPGKKLGAEHAESETSSPEGAIVMDHASRGLRTLIIDDRAPFLAMLEAGLAQFGHAPVTATSGNDALDVFQTTPVDLVICDLGMPEMDGWEVGRRVKEICRERTLAKTPFILLTGEVDLEDLPAEDKARMNECGVDAIVGKPIDIPDLLEIADALIAKLRENVD